MQRFEITYYWGPQGDRMGEDVYLSAIREAGFTAIPLENSTLRENKRALSRLDRFGLTCCALWDGRIQALIESDAPQERVDETVGEVIADYGAFDNVTGWWLKDEPSASLFPVLARVTDAFRRLDGREVFIDLYPDYAPPEKLGCGSYGEYLRRYVETVRPSYLCYDHYHFMPDGTARSGFFENTELLRSAGQKYGLPVMTIQLLTAHMDYGDLTRAQLLWEANMALAYGMKRLSFFTFFLTEELMAEGWHNACMNSRGEKYPHYEDVQAVNARVLPVGRELFGRTSAAVFHVGDVPEKGCTPYDGSLLGPAEGSDFVLGFFDDGSFLAVNRRYREGASNTLILSRVRAARWFDAADSVWKDAALSPAVSFSGGCTLTLQSGEGILLREISAAAP